MISTENIELSGSVTWKPYELTLGTDQNDLDVTSTSVFITPEANITITGLSYDPEANGKMLWIRNRSATYSITLEVDSSSSTADHRIFNDTLTDIVITPNKRVSLLYDNGWWTV